MIAEWNLSSSSHVRIRSTRIPGQREAFTAPSVLRTDHRDERFAQDEKLNMSVPTQRRSDCFHTSATFVRFPGKTVESTVTAGY